MAKLNWFTIAALLAAVGLTIFGTILVIVKVITLDDIAAFILIGTVGCIAAILSLHETRR
jgi:hypothetical protein